MERVLAAAPDRGARSVRAVRAAPRPARAARALECARRGSSSACAARSARSSAPDEDRILRAFLAVVLATLRTNYFRRDAHGQPRAWLSIKLDPGQHPRPAAAAAGVRDLRAQPASRGRAPAQGPDRPRRHPLVGATGGLSHRDPRADEGAARQEHADRAGRRQGRLRRAPAGAARARASCSSAK